jgi:hypothetical protein
MIFTRFCALSAHGKKPENGLVAPFLIQMAGWRRHVQGQDVGYRGRGLVKRGSALRPQSVLGRRILGTRTAHPYHPEQCVPQGW